MSVKKVYCYFFYKLYKFWDGVSYPKFWSDWKSSLTLDCLIYFIVTSAFIYYKVFFNITVHLSENNNNIFISVIVIVFFNYFIFHHQDQWKDLITEYDKLPERKNNIGSWIVFGVILLIVGNLIFSFYCLDQKAKENQTGPYASEVITKKRKKDSLQKAQQIQKLKKIYGEDKK
ncbi:hypothetical protein ODZ84_18980 [Chryseobacterium fluminis]|uniref:hypothetical protein n=1 Tax=Chryseobacterium fluminis TaxID=2983606 RepID=UPI00225AFD92|nr:hypothetical protein [Chryseobacterium sp. MMS21-Ot14]UZT97251.1 hypothetical protein ODZ84_18980 [Chryseobacterium sp. MMS21-Ot14]